jgi:hypothetical protein
VSKAPDPDVDPARAGVDRWEAGRALLRAADPPVAELADAEPDLDLDGLFDGLSSVRDPPPSQETIADQSKRQDLGLGG